jgi:hypothetical protein
MDLEIGAIGDPSIETGVPGGNALLALVDACMVGTEDDRTAARVAVREELGDDGLMHAAGVFGNFQMMNRIAEGTGIPIPRQRIDANRDVIGEIGLERMLKSQHG